MKNYVENLEPIQTNDWLLARDILIRGDSTISLWNGFEGVVITPNSFKQSIYEWQRFRVTGIYPESFKHCHKIENDFFLFCTRSNNCFSFIDPSEMKAMFDAQYRIPLSIWKEGQIIRKYKNVGETFFSIVPIEYANGIALFPTEEPVVYVRRVMGSMLLDRENYSELLEKLPSWVKTVVFNVTIGSDFGHNLNIKFHGENSRQWSTHGFSLEDEIIPRSHLDFIETISQSLTMSEMIE